MLTVASVGHPQLLGDPVKPPPIIGNAAYWTAYQWKSRVELFLDDFPNLDLPLVLAVISKESAGNPHATDGTGLGNSVGLMQVIPQTWIPCYAQLSGRNGPNEINCQIYAGMWMLSSILKKADGNLLYALAAYNCGFVSVDAGKCYSWGGYTYARIVMFEIYPSFTEDRSERQ